MDDATVDFDDLPDTGSLRGDLVALVADKVMRGQVEAENGFRVMASDVPAGQPFDRGTTSFFVSVRGSEEDDVTAAWEKLSNGANVLFPLGPAPPRAPRGPRDGHYFT